MSDAEGRKFTEIKHWLAERAGGSGELSPLCQYTAWMLLCKRWVYTHRLPPLRGTHNMRRARACAHACAWCLCGWVRGYMCVNIQYLSATFHAQRHKHTYYADSIHTNYCPDSKGLRSSIWGVRWHGGSPWSDSCTGLQLHLHNTCLMTHMYTHTYIQ